MKRKWWILLLVLPLAVAAYVQAQRLSHAAEQKRLQGQVRSLQAAATALVKEEKYAQAADKFEELQVLLMNAGRYQEALVASHSIEEVSLKASERRSPWNYVRIAEAYLGMGDKERYIDWMEKAVYERGFSKLDYFKDARLDSLRDHPRFEKLADACARQLGVGLRARDFTVALLDGASFSLSSQIGRVVLIDFWDVRCAPCRREMPNLRAIFRDHEGKGLEIIGISLDTDRKLLDAYVKEAGLGWKIACSLQGWSDSTAKLYRISATPSTWLIDRHGVVRYCDVRGAELRHAVEELLGES
jgi:peroxiredoxin